jgi:outer membrane protein assembly factor BamE (lipoprotein component of BamABCDE complex)
MNKAALSFTLLAALAGVTACAPARETHGWIADSGSTVPIQPGVDTKSTVLARMGTPSTQGFMSGYMEGDSWYYITTLQERFAFYKPKTAAREVTVVRFAADDTVAGVDKFGLEKGRVVAYDENKTPTRGRELGILEQLLGNVGNRPQLPQNEDRPDG